MNVIAPVPQRLWYFIIMYISFSRLDWISLQWRHNGRDSLSNHQPHDCLLNRLFRCRSKKTSKFRVTGLYAGNSPGTVEFSAQMASNAENVYIWWRHHEYGENRTNFDQAREFVAGKMRRLGVYGTSQYCTSAFNHLDWIPYCPLMIFVKLHYL